MNINNEIEPDFRILYASVHTQATHVRGGS